MNTGYNHKLLKMHLALNTYLLFSIESDLLNNVMKVHDGKNV